MMAYRNENRKVGQEACSGSEVEANNRNRVKVLVAAQGGRSNLKHSLDN